MQHTQTTDTTQRETTQPQALSVSVSDFAPFSVSVTSPVSVTVSLSESRNPFPSSVIDLDQQSEPDTNTNTPHANTRKTGKISEHDHHNAELHEPEFGASFSDVSLDRASRVPLPVVSLSVSDSAVVSRATMLLNLGQAIMNGDVLAVNEVLDRHTRTEGEDTVKSVLNTGLREAEQQTLLFLAASKGNIDVCRALITHGANVNQTDAKARAPLHLAIAHNRYGVCKFLLELGADSQTIDMTAIRVWSSTNISQRLEALVLKFQETNTNQTQLQLVKQRSVR